MSLESMMFLGLQLIALCMAMVFVWVLVTYVPPRVVETRIDPPPNAHYQIVSSTADTLDPEAEDAIRAQKVAEVFYHALTFNDGFCSVRTLHKIIEQEWNSHYRHYPEYKKHWLISRIFIQDVVMEWDYETTGRVIQLATIDKEEVRPTAYVLLPAEAKGGDTRRLYALDELVKGFIVPKPPKEPEQKEPIKPEPTIAPPPDNLWAVADKTGDKTGEEGVLFEEETLPDNEDLWAEGVLFGADTLPKEPELNGYHNGSLWG